MLFSKLSLFKQRQPRSFSYIPRYHNEEQDKSQYGTSESRIRQAFGSMERPELKTFRDRMEERRLMGSYDTHAARRKTITLITLLIIITLLFFWIS